MKEIQLTNSPMVALVSDGDFAALNKRSWHRNSRGYPCAWFIDVMTDMHRVIFNDGRMRDHKDGNRLNNTRSNLRLCTYSQNQWNRKKQAKKSTSRFKGVNLHRPGNMWHARIKKHGIEYGLGSFRHEEEAALAYNIAAEKLFGRFAKLNDL